MSLSICYLNRDDRPERRRFMEAQCERIGWKAIRRSATMVTETKGFKTVAGHGNWLDHEALIRECPTLILEDDALIVAPREIEHLLQNPPDPDYRLLYFHSGGTSPSKVVGLLDIHAYAVNPLYTHEIADQLAEARMKIEKEDRQDHTTFVDYFLAQLQSTHLTYATPDWAIQARETFGSDSGVEHLSMTWSSKWLDS